MVFTRARKKIPGPQYSLNKLVQQEIMAGKNIKTAVDQVKKAKILVQAKIDGVETKDAKKLAGVKPTTSIAAALNNPIAKKVLAQVLEENGVHDDPGLSNRLKEMWHHKKVRAVKITADSATMQKEKLIEEDDTDMWKYSMDRVLELRGYLKSNKQEIQGSGGIIEASSINFNVLQIPEKKEAA